MDKETIDAKSVEASSASTTADDKQGTNPSDVQPSVKEDVKEKTIADVVQETFSAAEKEDSSASTAEGEIQELNPTKKEETAKGNEDPNAEKKDPAEAKLPPFHEHPRWKEVVSERDTLKTRLDELSPQAKNYQDTVNFCTSNGITPQEYQEGVRMVALLKTDPEKAREVLAGVLANISKEVGATLPNDLQEKVDSGEITEEMAKRVARAEAQTRMTSVRSKQSVEHAARQTQESFVKSVQSTLSSWDTAKQSQDPDFAPKADATEPDGKYEWFIDKLALLMSNESPKTPQDAARLADKAYASVQQSVSRFIPARPTRKSLSSTKSSATKEQEPDSIADVVRATARKHGVEF